MAVVYWASNLWRSNGFSNRPGETKHGNVYSSTAVKTEVQFHNCLTVDWARGGLQNIAISWKSDRHEILDGSLGGCSEVRKPS